MSQHYSDQTREEDDHALPDVEVFYVTAEEFTNASPDTWMAERRKEMYEQERDPVDTMLEGWFYWFCFPGCLPDSDPVGPFDSEALALADARDNG